VCRYSALGSAQGGVLFLRPCAAVAAHMAGLAAGDERLQFRAGHAEQDFFNWCGGGGGVHVPEDSRLHQTPRV